MLRRIGNKSRLLPKLLPLFPENITTFIDMFMGSGAVTFAMVDRVKYLIANDNDDEVFNLFMVVKERKEELINAVELIPRHEKLFEYWKEQKEGDSVWQATRFLMLSNFGYMGKPDTLRFGNIADKLQTLSGIDEAFKKIVSTQFQFMSCDFRKVLSRIHWRHETDIPKGFIYADPPYLETGNTYQSSFTEDDTEELFNILVNQPVNFALSEFRHPLVMALAEEHGLHVTSLGERRNLKNRREEILITNYQPERRQGSLFPSEGTAASPANNGLQPDQTSAEQISML